MNKFLETTRRLLTVVHKRRCILEQSLTGNSINLYPAQHRILMELVKSPGASQKELANMLQVSGATMTNSIKKLIKSGYVVRYIKENDCRYNVLEITDSGRAVLQKSKIIFDKLDDVMFLGFSESDIDSFGKYLDKIYHNLNECSMERFNEEANKEVADS